MCSRLEMCPWINSNPHVIRNIFFTDEAHFNRGGVNSTRNSHSWDSDKPHGTVESITVLLFATPLTFCIPYQMLLTSLIRKHVFPHFR